MVYCGKDSVERFVEHIEDEAKRLHASFSQQLMTKLTDLLRIEPAEKCNECFEKFAHAEPRGNNDFEIRNVRDHRHYAGL